MLTTKVTMTAWYCTSVNLSLPMVKITATNAGAATTMVFVVVKGATTTAVLEAGEATAADVVQAEVATSTVAEA